MKNAGLSDEEIVEITGCEVDKNGEFMLECENSKSQEALNASADKKEAGQPKDGVIVIPSKPDEVTRIDYDLTYYVNDINTVNAQVLMTYGRNQTEKAVYVYGQERIAEDDLQVDETSDYLYDGRGSVVQTTIEAEIDISLTYDPFGEITSGADENFVGYAYNGEESNEVTGLQYLRARYYDTELGSFITIDTYLGSLDNAISQNRYTYANNDPVNNIDPTGHYSVNVNGTSQYYQTTGLNELRDYMTAAALWAGQVTAQSSFNGSVARASNTSFMNYQSITGISQSTANSYINKGIAQAGQVSMNYGCAVPTVPNQAVAKFSNNVNAAKNSANARISSIKAQKKVQYDEYQAYLRWLEEQRKIEEELRKLLTGISENALFNIRDAIWTLASKRVKSRQGKESNLTVGLPKWVKEIGARGMYLIKFVGGVVTAPIKAITAEVGMGIGIGVEGSAKIKGIEIEGGASTSITDSLSYDKGKFDIKNTTSTKVGITFSDIIDFSYATGKEHSFFDQACGCSILHDSFVEQSNCPANKKFQGTETTLGISLGAYLGLGGEVSVGFDLKTWYDGMKTVLNEPYISPYY